jgi:hypothetical protein
VSVDVVRISSQRWRRPEYFLAVTIAFLLLLLESATATFVQFHNEFPDPLRGFVTERQPGGSAYIVLTARDISHGRGTQVAVRTCEHLCWISDYDQEHVVVFTRNASVSARWMNRHCVKVDVTMVGPDGFVSRHASRVGNIDVLIDVAWPDAVPVRDFSSDRSAEISTGECTFPVAFLREARKMRVFRGSDAM